MNGNDRARVTGAAMAAWLLLVATGAGADGTRIWELAGFEELDLGETDGTSVSSRSEVRRGLRARPVALEETGLVWSAARDRAGRVYVGTGYEGKVYRVEGAKAVPVATTGQLVVTSMAFGADGALYLATLPDAVIWRVKKPGEGGKPAEAERFAKLPEGVQHVWALAFDPKGRTLYAGTGPEGKLLVIGPDGRADVLLETGEEHVLSLAVDGQGRVLAGTSPGALLLRVSGPGRSTALADFEGTEVKALAVDGDRVWAAVNKFLVPPAIPTKSNAANNGNANKDQAKARVGDGSLHLVDGDGSRELWSRDKAHVMALALDGGGTLWAGLGVGGEVISVDAERVVRRELDLDERQVMALLAGDGLEWAVCGDAAAIHKVEPARAADATYRSPPLDAKSLARWGRLRWFAEGGPLVVRARTGNSALPDDTWSDWSPPLAEDKSPAVAPARYLQLSFSWAKAPEAVLISAELSYRPANVRATITSFDPDSPYPAPAKKNPKPGDKTPTVSVRTIEAEPAAAAKPELVLQWKVDNPDGDDLRARLWYRALGDERWRPITRDDELVTQTRYVWDTQTIPEGRYRIRLRVDDSLDNGPDQVLGDERISVPVIVDNHPPRIVGLKWAGGRVRGRAEDGFSAISSIQIAIDDGPWLPLSSRDGVLDSPVEEFEAPLPEGLAPGPHSVGVRAFDRGGNMGVGEVHVDVD